MKIAVVIGTRPEIIKMSPVIRALQTRGNKPEVGNDYFIIHTGQHYSYNMDRVFLDQLQLPEARYNLEVGSGLHGEQTAKILSEIEKVFVKEKPAVILVQGDTNTVLAGALAAAKLHIKVGHVEAGLRSYQKEMPEEINRILTDHCSDYLFAPTEKAQNILLSEGIPENKIFVTGNTIVDAVYQNLEIASGQGDILNHLHLQPKKYFLVTIHRPENVDNRVRFAQILHSLDELSRIYKLPVIYPVHPRSLKMIQEFKLSTQNITLIDPVDFFSFLVLEKQAKLILTDSGGVQEESCILGTPCVTLRDNTERPETVDVGANMLAGVIPARILECIKVMMQNVNNWQNPFGDGKAGRRIIDIIQANL